MILDCMLREKNEGSCHSETCSYFVRVLPRVLLLLVADHGYVSSQSCAQTPLIEEV